MTKFSKSVITVIGSLALVAGVSLAAAPNGVDISQAINITNILAISTNGAANGVAANGAILPANAHRIALIVVDTGGGTTNTAINVDSNVVKRAQDLAIVPVAGQYSNGFAFGQTCYQGPLYFNTFLTNGNVTGEINTNTMKCIEFLDTTP